MDKIFSRRQIISLGFLALSWLMDLLWASSQIGFLGGVFFLHISFLLGLIAFFRIAKDCFTQPRWFSFVFFILTAANVCWFGYEILWVYAAFGINPA